MIDRYLIRGQLVGTVECSWQSQADGSTTQLRFYCPHCGEVWAAIDRCREEAEPPWTAIRFLFEPRPCGQPLRDPHEDHPTLWAAASPSLIRHLLEEYFRCDPRKPCRSAA